MNTNRYIKSLSAFLTCAVMLCNLSTAAYGESMSSEENTERNTNVTLGDMGYAPAEIMSNADSGFLFYDQLDENNKASYQAIEEYLSAPSDTALTVVLDEPIVLARSSRTISKWSDEEYTEYADAIIDAVMPGVIACTLDYPELFWLNFAEVGCGMSDSGTTYASGTTTKWNIYINEISVTPNYDPNFSDFDEVLEIREQVLQAVEDFEITGDTDYEKCKSIYQSIVDSTLYDTSAPYAHGIAGVLYDNSAVCEGFAKTFKILCDRENIPCLSILGNYNPELYTAHMWNYVYLDGEWYACDVTFDDVTENLTYFMRGSDFFNQNHTPESPYSIIELSFPEISEDDYTVPEEPVISTTTTTATTTVTTTSETTTVTTTSSSADTTISTTSGIVKTEPSVTTQTTTTTPVTETTTVTTTSEKPATLSGDVNEDGIISIADAVLLRKYLIGVKSSSDLNLTLADCDENRCVNVFDACILLRILISL